MDVVGNILVLLWTAWMAHSSLVTKNESRDIAAVIESSGFSTLIQLMMQAGLKQALMMEGPFTLFAPTDEAFNALNQTYIQAMASEENALQDLLLHHIVSGKITAHQIFDGSSVATLSGDDIHFSVNEFGIRANGANVMAPDVEASNGVIHVVDRVLIANQEMIPMANSKTMQENAIPNNIVDVASSFGLTTFVNLLSKAGLAGSFSGQGTFTVFAPSEEAFGQIADPALLKRIQEDGDILRNILLYHIAHNLILSSDLKDGISFPSLQGQTLQVNVFEKTLRTVVTINGATFERVDIKASNGVLHIVDKVLIPPVGDVWEVLKRDPSFTLFAEAVNVAGMDEFLKRGTSLTLLAPTNKAFEKIDPNMLEKALDAKEAMSEMIMSHVILGTNHGPLFSPALCWDSILTANNVMLKTGVGMNNTLKIASPHGPATIMRSDITASNGVIHEINSFL